jgi:hypothetical protein
MSFELSLSGRHQAVLTAFFILFTHCHVQAETSLIQRSAQASLSAREHCQVLMHEDADAFTQCADELLRSSPVRTAEQRYAKLGVAYYAWLSATAAAKNGLPSAAQSSEHFILIFRPLQKQLKVSDEALCATIEGDCVSRNARMLIVEQEALAHRAAPNTAKRKPLASSHSHN